jgi:hypothetical protein
MNSPDNQCISGEMVNLNDSNFIRLRTNLSCSHLLCSFSSSSSGDAQVQNLPVPEYIPIYVETKPARVPANPMLQFSYYMDWVKKQVFGINMPSNSMNKISD